MTPSWVGVLSVPTCWRVGRLFRGIWIGWIDGPRAVVFNKAKSWFLPNPGQCHGWGKRGWKVALMEKYLGRLVDSSWTWAMCTQVAKKPVISWPVSPTVRPAECFQKWLCHHPVSFQKICGKCFLKHLWMFQVWHLGTWFGDEHWQFQY